MEPMLVADCPFGQLAEHPQADAPELLAVEVVGVHVCAPTRVQLTDPPPTAVHAYNFPVL